MASSGVERGTEDALPVADRLPLGGGPQCGRDGVACILGGVDQLGLVGRGIERSDVVFVVDRIPDPDRQIRIGCEPLQADGS
jgi:hypothetical protein